MAKEMNGEMDKESLRQLLEKHESEPGALIPILQEIQESFGYLPEEALVFVSEEVGIPLGKIYGVVTFYSQFYLSPRGKNIIRVCHGTACHIGGAERISEAVSEELGVDEGSTTEDGEFTVERVACLGCCSLAPCLMVNDETHARLSPRKIKRMVKKYRKTRVD